MKTAISMPDEVFERVERRVKLLNVSRSEFFARAAERYLTELDNADLTARIDAAVESTGSAREQAQWGDIGLGALRGAARPDEW